MEVQNIEAALEKAFDSIRKRPAYRRRKNVSYAVVVKVGYEEIQKLRSDGYSYDVICRALSQNGALHISASPKHLCTAFLREKKRRLARVQENAPNGESSRFNAQTKKMSQATTSPNMSVMSKGIMPEKVDQRETKIRSTRVIQTGLGKIIRKPDGSFEY